MPSSQSAPGREDGLLPEFGVARHNIRDASPQAAPVLIGIGPNPDYAFVYVLVESGADYVVLPEKAGLSAGIPLPPKPTATLSGVGGSVSAELVRNVALEFQSLRIAADVMFDYSNAVPPLFGRSGIRALDIGLDPNKWHWKA